MSKILITAIGGDIGYGVIKAIKQSGRDMYIIGCDTQRFNYSYDLVEEFYLAPSYKNEKDWLEFILDILKKNEIEYFWPITEKEIQIVNENIDLFLTCKVSINLKHVLDVALDKKNTAICLSESGVNTPKVWEKIEEYNRDYPVVVKERFSCGSHGVVIANNKMEMITSYANMDNPVIQEYIGSSDEEYTMTIFSDGIITNSVVFKRTLGFGGMSRYVELIHDSKTDEIAKIIAKYLGLKGSINVQMRKKECEYYIFEINPRISSTIGFRVAIGFNDVAWWLDMLDKKQVTRYETPNNNIYGVRGVEEKVFIDRES